MGADQKTKTKEIVVEDQTSFTDMIVIIFIIQHTMNRALRKNKKYKVQPMEDMSFKSDFKRLPSSMSKTSETKKKTITIKINKSFKDEDNTEANSPRSQQFNKKSSFGSEAR